MIDEKLIDLYIQIWNTKNYNNMKINLYARTLSRDKINFGWCYQFALVIQGIYGGIIMSSVDDDHVWVNINGRDYDSDHINGHPNMDKYGDAEKQNSLELDKYWGRNYGRSGPIQFDVIELTINFYLEQQKRVA